MRCSFFLCLTPNQLFGFSRKYVGIDDVLLPNREWNQKQKHKKTALGQRGMLRIWRRDCVLCVIGNEFPCANHTAPPPPSYEGSPHCPKDKNRSPFHGEKPLMIT